ncbi:radical SAM/SPASM domain-containing protein [Syntrophorhabdus aromaticivorans]|uniref:SPASM domain-containing protein n=1 Tax=Syntrophorhabdus aromaticivorans TaxID=328301 RepID=A0A971S1E9_9BACT|nr:SPASM domain-containing protein [Syntrophorhabdus aromaticivorans]NLW36425.1 SPASM domain-containing protein [Syntrophorhabdus aromaticivorans]
MRRPTEHSEQLKRMYSKDDGRLQGEDGWEKFPFFWFILFLSYKCTRRCQYCYAYNQVGDDNTGEMDEDTFSRLLEWIPEVWKVNNVKVNAVGFLGGEPLLRTERIKRVMDSVYQNTDGMQGFLYTNGDLIDSVNWDDLVDIQWMSTNITDISIEELSRRMTIISERSNVIGQTIVATLDEYNLERVLDISRFGIENGYRLRYYGNAYKGLDTAYKKRLLKKYHELCDLLEDYVVKGYDVHTTFLLDFLIPLWDLELSPYPCGKRLAVVYPDGTIGPCIRNHSFKTGTIFDENPLSKIQCYDFHHDIRRPDLPHECKKCEVRTTCHAGCPNDKLLFWDATSGKSVVCDVHREIIPRLRHLDKLKNGVKSKPSDV